VLAGRDIGTVVLPDAPLKFYFDASEEARATRRGTQASQDAKDARHDIAHRDVIDSTRKVSPLRPADDAIVIDTTNMTLE
jgi:cytidylate kinase